jgi:SsrA-binding protein
MSKDKKKRLEGFNRKGKYGYELLKFYTAGLQLCGSEVKSVKQYHFAFADAYCLFIKDELYLRGFSITPIGGSEHVIVHDRKLLLKRSELDKISSALDKGITIIPTKIFENDRGRIKLEIAVARGKKEYDKRETIKKRDAERQMKTDI